MAIEARYTLATTSTDMTTLKNKRAASTGSHQHFVSSLRKMSASGEEGMYKAGSASPQSSKGSKQRGAAQPLRRGDACLMCRAKKLKCSATKPTCDQCAKRKDPCRYDAIRPASRVEKLQRKFAMEEEQEIQAVLSSRRHSAGASTTLVSSPFPSPSYGQPPHTVDPNLGTFDMGIFQFQPPPPLAPSTSPFHATITQPDATRPQSMPNPQVDAMQGWSWPNTATPASGVSDLYALPPGLTDVQAMPWSLLSSSNDVSTLWPSAETMSVDPMQTQVSIVGRGTAPMLSFLPDSMLPSFAPALPTELPSLTFTGAEGVPPEAQGMINEVIHHAANLGTPPLAEKDISQAARDYLLDLFFSPPRAPFGAEAFTESQFRAKLLLPLDQQPHPCLLFAMYTLAASASYIPAVRTLSESLHAIALVKLDEAINAQDRLLDAINASKMLGKWVFAKGRALEGYQIACKGIILVKACQLHRIPTSVWTPDMAVEYGSGDDVWPLLGPPKDQWDLCERIHAFWGAWGNDRGMSCTLPWDAGFSDDMITTPYPLHPSEYLNGKVREIPDFTIRHIYLLASDSIIQLPTYTPSLLFVVVHLLHRAKNLRKERAESCTSYTQLARLPSRDPTRLVIPRVECPQAYAEIMGAIHAVRSRMPKSHVIRMHETPPWDEADTPHINVCLLAAEAYLHPITPYPSPDRTAAIRAARGIAAIIRLWVQTIAREEGHAEPSCFTDNMAKASRTKAGLSGPYALSYWMRCAAMLTAAAKVLRKEGRGNDADECLNEATGVLDALRSLSGMYQYSTDQVDQLEQDLVELRGI